MAIDRLGRAFVVFAMLAGSSVAHASYASHRSVAHSKVWLDARTHRQDGVGYVRMPAVHSKAPVDDPWESLHFE